MEEAPIAFVKDLVSTGYFFDELKGYTGSKDIDLYSFSRNFAAPFLAKKSEYYKTSGQPARGAILEMAAECLSRTPEQELADSIFALKKAAALEIEEIEKSMHHAGEIEKDQIRDCRQKTESAQMITKLLVSIIRSFKLTEVTVRRGKARAIAGPVREIVIVDPESIALAT